MLNFKPKRHQLEIPGAAPGNEYPSTLVQLGDTNRGDQVIDPCYLASIEVQDAMSDTSDEMSRFKKFIVWLGFES